MTSEPPDWKRRQFLKAAGSLVGAIGLTGASPVPMTQGQSTRQESSAPRVQPIAKPFVSPGERPKVGCVSWCFHSFNGGTSPEEAIDLIGKIGFDGIELILLAREDIEGFWTERTIDKIKRQLDHHKLRLSQFVLFQPVVEGLPSADPEERERNLGHFEAGCRIGKKLGAPIINIVAPWPRELSGPRPYLPRYYEISEPQPGEKYHIDIASGFDWQRTWQTFVETVKGCLERAKAHHMRLSIEHHTHTMIPDATSFLHLWDAIRDPALGYNLDTGWTLLQREYPPLAILKVRDHLANLHVRDIDGLMHKFVHIGEGVMDFRALAEILKAIEFTGSLSLEQDKHPGDMEATCRRYLGLMREYLP
ncbi:MAG: sugar phosphate isomerase/epimerase [Planctomycetota bacterium]